MGDQPARAVKGEPPTCLAERFRGMARQISAPVQPERMVEFLRDPRSYSGRPGRIRLVQTHASWLAITAGRKA